MNRRQSMLDLFSTEEMNSESLLKEHFIEGGMETNLMSSQSWNWVGSSCFLKKPTDVSQAHEPCESEQTGKALPTFQPQPPSYLPFVCCHGTQTVIPKTGYYLPPVCPHTGLYFVCVCVYFTPISGCTSILNCTCLRQYLLAIPLVGAYSSFFFFPFLLKWVTLFSSSFLATLFFFSLL